MPRDKQRKIDEVNDEIREQIRLGEERGGGENLTTQRQSLSEQRQRTASQENQGPQGAMTNAFKSSTHITDKAARAADPELKNDVRVEPEAPVDAKPAGLFDVGGQVDDVVNEVADVNSDIDGLMARVFDLEGRVDQLADDTEEGGETGPVWHPPLVRYDAIGESNYSGTVQGVTDGTSSGTWALDTKLIETNSDVIDVDEAVGEDIVIKKGRSGLYELKITLRNVISPTANGHFYGLSYVQVDASTVLEWTVEWKETNYSGTPLLENSHTASKIVFIDASAADVHITATYSLGAASGGTINQYLDNVSVMLVGLRDSAT